MIFFLKYLINFANISNCNSASLSLPYKNGHVRCEGYGRLETKVF